MPDSASCIHPSMHRARQAPKLLSGGRTARFANETGKLNRDMIYVYVVTGPQMGEPQVFAEAKHVRASLRLGWSENRLPPRMVTDRMELLEWEDGTKAVLTPVREEATRL